MRRSILGLAIMALGIVSGCGDGAAPPPPGTPKALGPHNGPAVPLPGDRGYAEVMVDLGKLTKGKTSKSQLVVWFLQKDAQTPLNPPPTSVTAKLNIPGEGPQDVTFNPEPKAGDPASAGRFVAGSGRFDFDELGGEITAIIDGQSVTFPFRLQ